MTKLPVFRTVGQAFGFVVERRFFTLLRLVWFPAFLSILSSMMEPLYLFASYGILPQKVEHQIIGAKVDLNVDGDPALLTIQFVDFILQLFLGAIIAVCVHRLILLDDRKPGVYFNVRLTREEWLYIFAWIGYFILFFVAICLPFLAHFYWVGTQDPSVGLPALSDLTDPDKLKALFQGLRLIPVVLLSVLLGLGALARFGLVFPIIVAEGRLSFLRSWIVTRGNFLRLVGFWIVTTILTVVLILAMIAVLAVAVAGMVGAVFAGGETVGALGIMILSVPAAVSLLVYLVVGITIFIAAMSFSYKALAQFDGPKSLPDD